ncbi:MAG TPA: thiamine phosphate synthase [Gaiellaceae bacterium]
MILHAIVRELETARAAIAGGATVVQLRLKGVSSEELAERGRAVRDLSRERGVTFVVNDDVAAALELGADGVHLGRDDPGMQRARKAGLLLGLSAQSLDEALAVARNRPDYLGVGPIWPTPTKPEAPAMGLQALEAICAKVEEPVIAIGGIDATNAAACLEAGAAGVAVVRAAADTAALRAVLAHAAV